jgi:hypothetical protein
MKNEADQGRRLAIYDRTSGLLSRWYFELRLQEESERCKRYGYSLTLIRLKVASTSNGFTDALQVSSALKSVTQKARSTDLITAIGVTEIAICLVQCDLRGSGPALRRFLEDAEGVDWLVGVAVYPADDLDGKNLLDLALSRSTPWRSTRQLRSAVSTP